MLFLNTLASITSTPVHLLFNHSISPFVQTEKNIPPILQSRSHNEKKDNLRISGERHGGERFGVEIFERLRGMNKL
jgi:hypothetical protein